MSLLSGFKRFGGGLLDFAQRLGEQQYNPIGNPELESASDEFAPLLRQRYQQQFRAARALAVQKGVPFYAMNDVAAAQAQPAYDEGLVNAVRSMQALKAQRQSDERMQALRDHIMGSQDLTEQQKGLALALPEEDQAKMLSELELPSNDRYKFMSTAGGGVVQLDGRNGGDPKMIVKPQAPAGGVGGLGAASGVTDQARRMNALQYIQTGKVPSFGNSKMAAQLKIQVMNDAAQLLAEQGNDTAAVLAKQQALAATKSALGQVQRQGSANKVAERTMLKNFELAKQLSKDVSRAGVPLIDRYVQAGLKEIKGDPAVTKFHVALSTALSEFAKIKSGGAASAAQVTESAQQEAAKLLHPGMTQAQLEAAISVIINDAHNQIDSVNAQSEELQAQLAPFGESPTAETPSAAPAAPTKSASDRLKELNRALNGK